MAHHEINELNQPIGDPVPNWKPLPRPTLTTLTGRFCRLEPVNVDNHARELFDANSADNNNAMWTYLPYGPFNDFEQYREWMENTCFADDKLFFAIIDLVAGKAVGLAALMRIDPNNGSIEVGHLAYSPALQRQPAATDAMFLMMQYAFDLGYRRYEWKCNALNYPSRRAAQRLGFSYEGTFRQATVVKGRNRDTAWFAIIDREWPALRAVFGRWLAPENFETKGQQRESLSTLTAPLLFQRDQ